MDTVTLRNYRSTDAVAVSRLFRAVYGDHYVQPHVYLPYMISQNHDDGRWHSLVAVSGKKILGHATLFRNAGSPIAELALSVVHPATRGQNIATRLGQQLLIHAQALGCRGVTIKQVTHHAYSQKMADRLGFHSTGLLPDYAPSPFGEVLPESIVMGFRAIDDYERPLPSLDWPASCADFMQQMCNEFGTRKTPSPWVGPTMHFDQRSGRYDMVLKQLSSAVLQQLRQLPAHWMVSIRLRLAEGFAGALHSLSMAGFTFTGIVPDDRSEGWLALFHRDYVPRQLQLHCARMQQLQDQIQQRFGDCCNSELQAG
ncbi:GNAT family N-acetyltransferase [Pseudomonas syringae]|uniref:GNAT family N-acetyltransferase n=1 Tax=Pseudomonas syringae TaxID=317 RepID=UPI000F08277B|nr:GNAT family N-acetyltransferase [Pseudomonas syringae]MCF5704405.1 GNAT family N-acetyltransferase [Pseudomonas syringae]